MFVKNHLSQGVKLSKEIHLNPIIKGYWRKESCTNYMTDKVQGGVATRAALAEIGADHEIIDIDLEKGDEYTDEFTRINPCQQVPVSELPDGLY